MAGIPVSDVPEIGTLEHCARCGNEIVVTAIATNVGTRRRTALCRHVESNESACDAKWWASVDSISDYDGGFATWPHEIPAAT